MRLAPDPGDENALISEIKENLSALKKYGRSETHLLHSMENLMRLFEKDNSLGERILYLFMAVEFFDYSKTDIASGVSRTAGKHVDTIAEILGVQQEVMVKRVAYSL